ncbi:MAG: RNA 2',3'-cyclic phosphodiesterase [Chloroherpetonaceae bacterium]|nr:RNA 2',3'-cyclic phosphodiesterase [Chloroherpetonaceae bacterium]MDW8019552.1 RNA 2',3'-cyclic phosphodiesterase [Chloroherpetonaceae bacterium]MDW8467198.1 RNA 2',3'-cyclic phosphodiesterase [Chloroherpetonaceae bacterium]
MQTKLKSAARAHSLKIRAFVGIWLSEPLRERAEALQQNLMQHCPAQAVKWVERQNLHFTLKFLGEVKMEAVLALEQACRRAASMTAFNITVAGLGAFPSLWRPETIWVGIEEGKEQLAALAARLEEEVAEHGFAKSARPFSPHLTLGRVRDGRYSKDLGLALQKAGNPILGCQPVSSFTLIESRLTPQGPIYTPLADISLCTVPLL